MANSWDPVVGTAEYESTLKKARDLADESGWILNPDGERVEKVVGLMTINHNQTGRYFCPCKQSHPLDPAKDVICPCPDLSEEMQADGHCFCRLFYVK
jgi:ferredoxin-thioredoxin reductase catalytic subunit